MRGVGGGGGLGASPPVDPLAGSPVTRNAEIDPPPPPKMTQGGMTPLTPLHHLQHPPLAGSQGVVIATLIFRYFLRYFSSTPRTDLSRFRRPFIVSILLALLFSLFHKRS